MKVYGKIGLLSLLMFMGAQVHAQQLAVERTDGTTAQFDQPYEHTTLTFAGGKLTILHDGTSLYSTSLREVTRLYFFEGAASIGALSGETSFHYESSAHALTVQSTPGTLVAIRHIGGALLYQTWLTGTPLRMSTAGFPAGTLLVTVGTRTYKCMNL